MKVSLFTREVFVTERIGYIDTENKSLGKTTFKQISYGPSVLIGYVIEDAEGMEKKVVHYKDAKKSIYKEDSPSYLNEVFG
jgi:hypothetical protein|tara:strand:- start:25 stop:267 length:243 start_codon:yes stop_codon:yes gene_type:complete